MTGPTDLDAALISEEFFTGLKGFRPSGHKTLQTGMDRIDQPGNSSRPQDTYCPGDHHSGIQPFSPTRPHASAHTICNPKYKCLELA